MDILTKFLAVGMLLFPLGEVTRLNLGNGIAVTLNDVIIGLFGLIYFIKNKNKKELIIIVPFIISIIISLLLNFKFLTFDQLLTSLLYPLRWLLYLQVFFFVSHSKSKNINILKIFTAVGGVLYIILGFLQYFFYSNLGNLFYAGWDSHLYRLFSTVLDPNFAGTLYVLFFLFFLALFFSSYNRNKIVYLILSLLSMVSVFLTYSRSAMITLIISTFVFLTVFKKAKLTAVLLIAILSFYIFTYRYFNVESINPFRVFSTEARLQSIKIASDISLKNPFFGVGFNAYRYALIRYGYRKNNLASLVSHADASTDNSFLFVLATTGIIGFLTFIYFWKEIFISLKDVTKKERLWASFGFAVIAGIFVDSLFINALFFTYGIQLVWVMLGISIKENK